MKKLFPGLFLAILGIISLPRSQPAHFVKSTCVSMLRLEQHRHQGWVLVLCIVGAAGIYSCRANHNHNLHNSIYRQALMCRILIVGIMVYKAILLAAFSLARAVLSMSPTFYDVYIIICQ